jgi:hypothetical protein
MNIVPFKGYVVAKATKALKSLEAEVAEATGLKGFLVVDTKAGRSDSVTGRTRVREFKIVSVYEDANDKLKSYVDKNVYAVCFENEKENDIIIEDKTGDKLFIIPETSILAEIKD